MERGTRNDFQDEMDMLVGLKLEVLRPATPGDLTSDGRRARDARLTCFIE